MHNPRMATADVEAFRRSHPTHFLNPLSLPIAEPGSLSLVRMTAVSVLARGILPGFNCEAILFGFDTVRYQVHSDEPDEPAFSIVEESHDVRLVVIGA